MKRNILIAGIIGIMPIVMHSCTMKDSGSVVKGDVASKVYVAQGEYDEVYNFVSGGFSGQVSVYGLPSGRLLKVIPVFSVNPENGYGYSEETKDMLNTTVGQVPWDDQHHLALSQTNGEQDGRWIFANANNTQVDMSGLPTGNYIISVTIEGITKTFKVVKN